MNTENTKECILDIFDVCWQTTLKKNREYKASWRIFSNTGLVDQLFIKAARIRTILSGTIQKVKDEPIEGTYYEIVNYCLLGIANLELDPVSVSPSLTDEEIKTLHTTARTELLELFDNKNNDYGEAWRNMRLFGIIDVILVKIDRARNTHEDQKKSFKELFQDIANYAMFSIIKIEQQKQK